jgi:NAD(P)-dependent dehydrogenase (short-subunit alcohol dehydrogenase family)
LTATPSSRQAERLPTFIDHRASGQRTTAIDLIAIRRSSVCSISSSSAAHEIRDDLRPAERDQGNDEAPGSKPSCTTVSSVYAATKAAVHSLARSLRAELANGHVRVVSRMRDAVSGCAASRCRNSAPNMTSSRPWAGDGRSVLER